MAHGLDAATDEDGSRLEIHVLPGDAEDLRAAGPGDRGQQDRHLPGGASRDLQQAPELRRCGPVELPPVDPGALHGGDGVRWDEPVGYGLAERRAQHASDLGDGGGCGAALLRPGEDGSDVAGSDLREVQSADDRDDVPADVPLVAVQAARPDWKVGWTVGQYNFKCSARMVDIGR